MKKQAIAAAVAAALAMPAVAQVEVYGLLDVSYTDGELTLDGTKTNMSGLNRGVNLVAGTAETRGSLGGSRLGFRGAEDLGGGLKANFNLELELDPAMGDDLARAFRTSIVGISGGFGSVSFGRQTTGIHGVVTATSPIPGHNVVGDVVYSTGFRIHQANVPSTGQAIGVTIDPITNGDSAAATAVRGNNMVTYNSPVFSGGSVRVDYRNDSDSATTSVEDLGLSFRFTQGPLLVTAGTHTTTSQVGATEREFNVKGFGVAYSLGPVRVNAIYAENEFAESAAAVGEYNTSVWQIGATTSMGPWTFSGHYGEGDRTHNAAARANATTNSFQGYQVLASYALSKRTSLYGIYGTDEIGVSRIAGTGAGNAATWGGASTLARSDERSQMAFGVRHTF